MTDNASGRGRGPRRPAKTGIAKGPGEPSRPKSAGRKPPARMPSKPASAEMRVQRALAQAGVASRRQGEELIKAGKVRIDGKVAELGSKVNPSKQKITVNGRVVKAVAKRWLAFNKPLGIVTTADDEQGRQTVFDLIPDHAGLTYVGRLDVMTTGLLLLTTDGEAVHRLTHPKYHIQRKYTALVHGRSTAEIASAIKENVVLDGRPVIPRDVRVRPGQGWPQHHRCDLRGGSEPPGAAVGRGDGAQGRAPCAPELRSGATGRPAAGTLPPAAAEGRGGPVQGDPDGCLNRRAWHVRRVSQCVSGRVVKSVVSEERS